MGKFLVRIGARLGEGTFGRIDAALTFVALYFLFQTLTLPIVSHFAGTGVGIDDAEQLIYLPHFWMGYGGSQPPLYGWLNTIGAQLFGTSILSLKIVKYVVLFLAILAVGLAVRRLDYPRRTAAAAMVGMFTIPQIVWEAQHALSNSIAALAFSALALLALILVFEKRTPLSYALFGLAVGLAILAKYNDALFVLAMVAAALTLPTYRPAILSRWLFLSVVVLCLVLLPTAIWSLKHSGALLSHAHKFETARSSGGSIPVWLFGAGEIVVATFDFAILPFGLIVIAYAVERLGPFIWLRANRPPEQFIGRTLFFALAITIVLVLVSGTTGVRDRWLLPLLFLLPAYAAMRAEAFEMKGRKIQYFLVGIGALAALLVVPATWYIQAIGGKGASRSARLDFPAFYGLLEKDGPVATIIGDQQWVGNFRLAARDVVLLEPEIPHFRQLIKLPATVVWLGDRPLPPVLAKRLEKAGYGLDGAVKKLAVPELLSEKGSRDVNVVRLKRERPVKSSDEDENTEDQLDIESDPSRPTGD